MKRFLKGTILIDKNTYIVKPFKIYKGTVTKRFENKIIQEYKDNEIVLLELINKNTPYSFHIETLTIGEFINYDYNQTINLTLKQSIHIELLLIKNPIITVTRFLYYKYLEKQQTCFYLDTKIQDLSKYLKIEKRQLSKIITHLINNNILTKQNKLIIIQNLNKLKELSFSEDY